MSLQFVLGSAGSGKTHRIYNEIIARSLDRPDGSYLLLVPEQFTMAAQAELARRHPDHVIMNVDVLSFNRLAYRVFDELGVQTQTVLEDTGKNLLLRQVAAAHEPELTHLRRLLRRPGYIDEMKSLLTELAQYHISPDDFARMLNTPGMSPSFAARGADILVMYRGFLEAKEGRFVTAEDLLTTLADCLPRSRYVRGLEIWCDGFTGFTPLQMEVMAQLLSLADRVSVAVTLDPKEDAYRARGEQELFAMSKTMVRRLTERAVDAGCAIGPPVTVDGAHTANGREREGRYAQGGALSFLEKHLFRDVPAVYADAAGGTPDASAIRLCRLHDVRAELTFAAASIRELVRTRGWRYRDICVLCPDPEAYGAYAEEIFAAYRVPLFLDRKAEILYHPLTELVRSAFGLVTERLSAESVLYYLRCGLSGFTPEETDRLDNYLYATGIRGRAAWEQEFTRRPAGMREEQLSAVNALRARLMTQLRGFLEACSGEHSVREFSAALRQLFSVVGAETQLEALALRREAEQKEVSASVSRQIFGRVSELLDKTDALLGGERMDAAEYLSLLESGMTAIDVGTIPPSADTVILGDLERTRLEGIRALFLLGAGNHAIPAVTRSGGLLTQLEREQLKDAAWELAPTDRERGFMQRFYLYLALTRPSELLVLTWPAADAEGKEVAPSYLVHALQRMFPAISAEHPQAEDPLLFLSAQRPVADALAGALRRRAEADTPADDLFSILYELTDPPQRERLREAAFGTTAPQRIAPLPEGGAPISGSVTRLETYARCPYSYFLRYELRLDERRDASFAPLDMGNFYHAALEAYAQRLARGQIAWSALTPEQGEALVDWAVEQALTQAVQLPPVPDPGLPFALRRMRQTLSRTVWALTEQVRRGSFTPQAFELTFGQESAMRIDLTGGRQLRLTGKIDRLDVWEGPDARYLKIVDYKSSAHSIDYSAVYHGRQLQLPLYMDAALETVRRRFPDRPALPGGLLYYHIDDPLLVLPAPKPDGETKEELLRALRPAGLVNDSPLVLRAMDTALMEAAAGGAAAGSSGVMRVTLKKDGLPDARSEVATTDELLQLQHFVRGRLTETGNAIALGARPARPYRQQGRSGCDYCPYRAVCGFDLRLQGYRYDDQPAMNKADWMEKL